MSLSEPDYDLPPTPTYKTPPALVAFTLTVLILCFVTFTIVYLCKCCFASIFHTWALQRTISGSLIHHSPERSPPRGLDLTLLERFPTFLYASVKDLRKEKNYSLECAICLLEFEDDNMLRLLTICYHVFHKECIDLWLQLHKTCPVCRTDLDSPPNQMSKHSDNSNNNVNPQEGTMLPCNDVHIDVQDEERDNVVEITIDGTQQNHHMSMNMQQEEHIFSRSHSTGHSIIMIREGELKDDDKYTLRLPEHVIRGGHNCTRSCTNYNEMTLKEPTPCN